MFYVFMACAIICLFMFIVYLLNSTLQRVDTDNERSLAFIIAPIVSIVFYGIWVGSLFFFIMLYERIFG